MRKGEGDNAFGITLLSVTLYMSKRGRKRSANNTKHLAKNSTTKEANRYIKRDKIVDPTNASSFDSGFRCAFVFISWVMLLAAQDGSGFFVTLTVICIPLLHHYHSFNPTNEKRKITKNIAFGIVVTITIIGVLGVFGIFEVSMRNYVAYIGLRDNIFFYLGTFFGLRHVWGAMIALPIAVAFDWLFGFFVTPTKN